MQHTVSAAVSMTCPPPVQETTLQVHKNTQVNQQNTTAIQGRKHYTRYTDNPDTVCDVADCDSRTDLTSGIAGLAAAALAPSRCPLPSLPSPPLRMSLPSLPPRFGCGSVTVHSTPQALDK
ncbi:hypothetical protein J6590_028679 [Homalodisca vitripennis]|nr:hypothetical protein J6590_028679 [Homalodisca vitripennis]